MARNNGAIAASSDAAKKATATTNEPDATSTAANRYRNATTASEITIETPAASISPAGPIVKYQWVMLGGKISAARHARYDSLSRPAASNPSIPTIKTWFTSTIQ